VQSVNEYRRRLSLKRLQQAVTVTSQSDAAALAAKPDTAAASPLIHPETDTLAPRRRIRLDWAAWTGLAVILLFATLALATPYLAPYDPARINARQRLRPPHAEHLLGTDQLGRDLLSRLLWGSRLTLGMAALAAVLTTTIGVSIGVAAGYYGGILDDLLMRLADILLGFPGLILALAIVGTLGPGLQHLVLGLVSVWWVGYARIARGLTLSIRERPYVEAVAALGAGHGWILWRHVLPNVISPIIVLATLEMGHLILAIAGLNFLGLGVQPPAPEWGSMLNEGRPYLQTAPQLMIYPGAAITLVVLGFNLLGDGLRDALDPRLR
jgi:peptide/nickel transport system permease protein